MPYLLVAVVNGLNWLNCTHLQHAPLLRHPLLSLAIQLRLLHCCNWVKNPYVNSCFFRAHSHTHTHSHTLTGFPLQDGGSPITSYTIEMKQRESDTWQPIATLADPRTFTDSFSDASLQHNVSQLNPGELYHFRAYCRNSVGVKKERNYSTKTVMCVLRP